MYSHILPLLLVLSRAQWLSWMFSLWMDHTSSTTNPGVQVKRKISFSTQNRNLIMWLPGSWHSHYIGLLPWFLLTKVFQHIIMYCVSQRTDNFDIDEYKQLSQFC